MNLSIISQCQAFLNGSFENNSANGIDQINIATNADFDALMSDMTAFGSFPNLDIIISNTYCGLAQDGDTYVALTGGLTDALSSELCSPLVVGQSYSMSFWARQCNPYIALPIQIGTSGIPNAQGTIIYTSTQPAESIWTEFTFDFIATSADSYITIGCISDNAGNDVSFWVQVDNFVLTGLTVPVLDLGPDVSTCQNAAVVLDATLTNADSYLWQDGSTGNSITVDAPGIYNVTVTIDNCIYIDEVVVDEIGLPSLELGADTTICEGLAITLYGTTIGAANYLWQNGSTGSSLTTSLAGNYYVVASAGDCAVTDSINIQVESFDEIDLGPDIFTCEGETVILHAQYPGYSVVWQDGSTGSTFDASAGGLYSIIYSHGQCSASDFVQVSLNPHPNFNWVEDSLKVCFDHPDTLDATIDGASYLWHDGTVYPTHPVSFSGAYSVTVTAGGCSTFDSIVMEIIPQDTVALLASATCLGLSESIQITDTHGHADLIWSTGAIGNSIIVDQPGDYSALLELTCQTIRPIVTINPCPELDIYVPNTFTPDADGINDVFIPSIFATIPIDKYSFLIFDRFGQPIFQTDKTDAVWDGGYLGSRSYVPNGVYAWKMVLTYGAVTVSKDGSILIIR